MRHHRALLGEALYVVGLLAEKRLGYEQREIGVLVTGILEHLVERPLHFLPDRIAVRLDDHAAAHGRILGQAGLHDQIVIPLGVVFLPRSQFLELLCHILSILVCFRKSRRAGPEAGNRRPDSAIGPLQPCKGKLNLPFS